MDLCLPTIGPDSAKGAIERVGTGLCSLDIHRFAHDRASAREDLEIRHGSPTRRNMASGSGKRSKGGG